MASSLLLIPFLLVAAAVPHVASHPAQVYWSKALPNTRMPAALTDLLNPDDVSRSKPCSPVLYEKDMLSGADITMSFAPSTTATLLSRRTGDSIWLSSADLPAMFSRFSINPNSQQATSFKKTIAECEAAPATGEVKRCVASLESMVDFTASALGTRRLSAQSSVVTPKEETSRVQKYTISPSGVKVLAPGADVVACHGMRFPPHAVFLCHKMEEGIRVYTVSAKGESGAAVEAVAVCHDNGVVGAPDACAVEPRADALCHLLPSDHIIWSIKKIN